MGSACTAGNQRMLPGSDHGAQSFVIVSSSIASRLVTPGGVRHSRVFSGSLAVTWVAVEPASIPEVIVPILVITVSAPTWVTVALHVNVLESPVFQWITSLPGLTMRGLRHDEAEVPR
ncbi:hypothetical protein GCM10010245_88410 [Streptomyces spectabilis]|nr:hypothetical protein GCM10010245_88410 [Streptomyces spectabilis]